MNSLRVGLIAAVLSLVTMAPVSAQGLLKHIERVTPRIAQRGTTVEVTIQGGWLKEPREVIFSTPGLRAIEIEPLPSLQPPITLAHGGRIEDQMKCRFEIAADCLAGEHQFRIRTADQLSTLATFHVSPFPVVDAPDVPHHTIATALPVPLNVTIRQNRSADGLHLFKVPAAPGTRLTAEVEAVRLADVHYGDSEFDLALRILDANGRELAANDDNPLHLQDPFISLKLPNHLPGDSVYVEVGPSVAGQGNVPYCLHVGSFSRPLAVFPPGGPSGKPLQAKLLGDPMGDVDQAIAIPDVPGTFAQFGDAPSPLLLRSSPFPNVLEEREATDTRISSLPVALNGVLDKPGDTDAFRLSVKQGDRYRVRVYSAALGSPLDPAIRIRPVTAQGLPGPAVAEADDADPLLTDREIFGPNFRSRGGLKDAIDPSIVWESKADGDYLIEVRDTNGFGAPTAVYRIEIETPPDRIYAHLTTGGNSDWVESTRYMGLAVPQGNRWTVNLNLPQGQGNTYRGGLQIIAQGLPPGVKLVSPPAPPGQTRWPVQLVTDPSAEPQGAVVAFSVLATDPDKSIESGFQQWVPFINHSGGDAWRAVRSDRAIMAITDPAPITIDLVRPTIALVRGGELAIAVKLARRAGYNESVDFQCEFAPQGVGLPPAETISGSATEATLRITAEQNAPLGAGPLFVRATTLPQGSGELGAGRVMVSSEIITITVADPFVELASQPTSIRRGAQGRFTFAVSHKTPFNGQTTARLLGLPKGVNVLEPLPVITVDSKEIVFEIEATEESLLGAVNGIGCELTVKVAGQEIRQRAGNGTLRIDPKL